MAKALRYYAQWGIFPSHQPGVENGWLIYDRNYTCPRGEDLPVALAVSRAQAFRIRDALNETDKSRSE